MYTIIKFCIASFLMFPLIVSASSAQNRLALVIGNSGYTHLQKLPNPIKDARLITKTLRKLGFKVTIALDLDLQNMSQVNRNFANALRAAGNTAVGVYFYAGHSIQFKGNNYLIPLGAGLNTSNDLASQTISVKNIISSMKHAGNSLNLVLLDASRFNKLSNRLRLTGSGLARISAPDGFLIASSAAPGQTAVDGSGANSLFTAELAETLQVPGLSVDQILKKVQASVKIKTRRKQSPLVVSSLQRDFYFSRNFTTSSARDQKNTTSVQPAAPAVQRPNINNTPELKYWKSFKNSKNSAALQSYLKPYSGSGGQFSMRSSRGAVASASPNYFAERKSRELALKKYRAAKLRRAQRVAQQRRRSLEKNKIRRRKYAPAKKASSAKTSAVAPLVLQSSPAPTATGPDASYLSAFPWPPPQPSARVRLPRKPFLKAANLEAVSDLLISPLRKAGYWEYSFHSAPNGFAMVTRLERINEDGSAAAENLRYRRPSDKEPFSLSSYFKSLFFAEQGYYRLIVFVVTDNPFAATGKPIEETQALNLLRGGANALPPKLGEKKFSARYGIDALIYEFKKGPRDKQVTLLLPGRLSPQIHFDKAGLSPAFGLQRN